MLSVLVPIYNFNVVPFVKDLHNQCTENNIDFEIICTDDQSTSEFKLINKGITSLKNVVYNELIENIGRSKIRNLLAKKAKFENLLFVDCDSKTSTKNYINNYLKNIKNAPVIYGGRNYEKNTPKNEVLRWIYGIKREVIPSETRNKAPHISFMANNFLIQKEIYQQIEMDESITEYGHEDTLFGKELKKNGITILHINNPLVHIGLEDAVVFLDKTKNGLKNLSQLFKMNKVDTEIKLIRTYENNKFIVGIFQKAYPVIASFIVSNLKSSKPSLFYFDLYKLYYFSIFMKQ
jgi:hypothetical protein